MGRKLFCQISPVTYRISVLRCICLRHLKNIFSSEKFAYQRSDSPLPVSVYKHNSLIRRRLGNVDMQLQENKAVNLSLAAPKLNGILIKPGQTFSFWHLVGNASVKRGFKEGLTITAGRPTKGIGGGMCQLTNLIHWMVLHTDLTVTELHHHDRFDLFPDFNRQVPFGTGTSILYNYLDYQVKNETDITYQLFVSVNEEYLCGEIRADKRQPFSYHIKVQNEFFSKESDGVYRNGEVLRIKVDPATGNHIELKLLHKNHAKVAYDTSNLDIKDLSEQNCV